MPQRRRRQRTTARDENANDLVELAQNVCQRVPLAERDDWIQELALLGMKWHSGHTLREVAFLMHRRLRSFYRRRSRELDVVALPEESLPAIAAPTKHDKEILGQLYRAALQLDPPRRKVITAWFEELLEAPAGAMARAAERAGVSLKSAYLAAELLRRGLRDVLKASSTPPPEATGVSTIEDVLDKLAASLPAD